jgi:hypothetical protein
MSGDEVRANAPVLSACLAFVMIIVDALGVGLPVAVLIIVICS